MRKSYCLVSSIFSNDCSTVNCSRLLCSANTGTAFLNPILTVPRRLYHAQGVPGSRERLPKALHCSHRTTAPTTNLLCLRSPYHRYLSTNTEPPQDNSIRAYRVQVVQSDGTLGQPISLQDALYARKTDEHGRLAELLRQVSPSNASRPHPICKYFNIKDEQGKLETQEKKAKAQKTHTKQFALNWTIGDNDLEYRLRKVEGLLEKGNQVEIVLGSMKRRGWMKKRPEDVDRARGLVNKIREAALSVKGARETKAMQGTLGQDQEIILHFAGQRPANES